MASFRWVRRKTRHFGDVLVSVARVDLRDSAGRFRGIAFQVDSGAVITLARRSVGEILGLPLNAGRKIDLTSVGLAVTYAHVHNVEARIDGDVTLAIPIAIAESEEVPNLLGRIGVFDQFRIVFDPLSRSTDFVRSGLGPE